jgi:hypothetical protein
MNQLQRRSELSTEKENRLVHLRKKYKVTWEWGDQDASEVLDLAIANILNRRCGRTVVRLKKELTKYR